MENLAGPGDCTLRLFEEAPREKVEQFIAQEADYIAKQARRAMRAVSRGGYDHAPDWIQAIQDWAENLRNMARGPAGTDVFLAIVEQDSPLPHSGTRIGRPQDPLLPY